MRANAADLSDVESLFFATSRSRFLEIVARPRIESLLLDIVEDDVDSPDRAATWAMPLPIVPPPMTPIVLNLLPSIYRSTARATALPPPRHKVAMPRFGIAPDHFIKQRHENARAAGADRMAESNRAAVDVHLRGIEFELFHDGDGLYGKRFVQFDKIDVGAGSIRSLRQQFPNGFHRSHHDSSIGSIPLTA